MRRGGCEGVGVGVSSAAGGGGRGSRFQKMPARVILFGCIDYPSDARARSGEYMCLVVDLFV